MKRLTIFAMALLVTVMAGAKGKGDWKGKVVDAQGEPVAYANVAVLSKADSTVVCGTVTEEDGTFNIISSETDGIMMVAMLGYRTQYLAPVDGAVITLDEDTAMLQGAVTTAIMPKTKLTGEGMQTNVRGSVLENAGSATDVLAKTPGIIKGQDGLEVIGKGTPLVYINGHKVSDTSELDRLQSNEIQSVEVITNPGAQYDATVRSVVRIRTVRRQGDGFGFSLNASDEQSLRWARGNDPAGALNVNYRTGGVDIFAGVNYARNTQRQISDAQTASYRLDDGGNLFLFENKGDINGTYFNQTIHGNAGVNWQISDNHFLGGKVEWGRHLQTDDRTVINTEVFENGVLSDRLSTISDDAIGVRAPYNLGANLYYNGLIKEKLGIDFNLDYYGTDESVKSIARETSDLTHDAEIQSVSSNNGRLYAAKLVLSYPIWMGQMQVGTEESISRRSDVYSISGVDIPASQARVKENNYAGFASYGFQVPKVGMFNAGVRYEYVRYAFEDALTPENSLTRNYGKWFPTVSYAGAFGPVQVMLNYSSKTRRPNYGHLSSAIRYNSRYIWQSGNARLQPEISHDVTLTAAWKFVTLFVDYTRTNDAMMTWSSPYNDDGVVLVQPRNIDVPHRMLTAYVNVMPTIGPWTMNYTVGVIPQWLTINVADPREASGFRKASFNGKPIFIADLQNTFRVKGGWQFEAGVEIHSRGYHENIYLTRVYCDITAAVQKTLLKDGSLVLRLEGSDLAGMARNDITTDFGSHTITQTNKMDTQRIRFSLRYNFNTAQSKYRGTGAGSDSKKRM